MPNPRRPEYYKSRNRKLFLFLLVLILIVGVLLIWRKEPELQHQRHGLTNAYVASPDETTLLPKEADQVQPDTTAPFQQSMVTIPAAEPIEISGRVVLLGEQPKERLLQIKKNRDGSSTETWSRDYEVSKGRGLANVFVYVRNGLEGQSFPLATRPLRLLETNDFLRPFVLGVQIEQMVEIANERFRHQHRLVSSRGSQFSWPKETSLELVFSERDVLSHITCKVHPWEFGYVGAVEHPYFAVTDANGYFKLPKGIPPGVYQIAAHHPKAGEVSKQVNTKPGGKYKLAFQIQAPKPVLANAEPVIENEDSPLEERIDDAKARLTQVVQRDTAGGVPVVGTDPGEGIVRGRVLLSGTPPPEKPLDIVKNDPNCGKLVDGVPLTRQYVVGPKGELADSIVYLEPLSKISQSSPPLEPLVIEAVRCQFNPYVAAIRTGQQLIVRNSDGTFHNAHFTPVPGGSNKELNKALMPKTEISTRFDRAEPFLRLKCDVHPWEFAYVSVFEHPFFAVTDREGRFAITNVPPGHFRLQVSHRKAGSQSMEFAVSGRDKGEMTITLEAK